MAHEAIELHEGARVEELLDPLPREELPPLPLSSNVPLARRVERVLAQLLEPLELGLGRVVDLCHRRGAYRRESGATLHRARPTE